MARQNVSISRYIKLVTDKELKEDQIKEWFRTVKQNGPKGILYGVQVVNRNGNPKTASLIHRKIDDGKRHEYVVPLVRDLTEPETEAIVQAWDAAYPGHDLDIEVSTIQINRLDQQAPSVHVPNDQYLGMCIQLAKAQHENWMRDRADAGWRYGPTISLKNKTHPLMRPWDQLPAKYRTIDQDTPQKVIQLINDFGYAVIRREELDSLLKLMRAIA